MGLLKSIAAAILMAAVAEHGRAQPAVAEDDVKAAFLYNFAKYVAWPPSAGLEPFRLCVVAEPGFVKRVDNLIAGETIEGRPVMRETPATPESARTCQILYVGASETARAERLLASTKAAPILTVGESERFLALGGMIVFVRDGDRVRFDVDNVAAQHAGLTISSRLLRLARHVGPREPAP